MARYSPDAACPHGNAARPRRRACAIVESFAMRAKRARCDRGDADRLTSRASRSSAAADRRYRNLGFALAQLDPLKRQDGRRSLNSSRRSTTWTKRHGTRSTRPACIRPRTHTLREIIKGLRQTYCAQSYRICTSPTGAEALVQQRFESIGPSTFRPRPRAHTGPPHAAEPGEVLHTRYVVRSASRSKAARASFPA